MPKMFRKLAMVPRGLRYKLLLTFGFMSIVPLLTCVYIVTVYVFPMSESIGDVSIIIVLSLVVAVLGLILAKGLVDPITEMAIVARLIANGEYDRKFVVSRGDEVGALADSINMMTSKIRQTLDELKSYGLKTKEVNLEIAKRVQALSNLLKLGDSISTGSMPLNSILEFAIQKVCAIFDTGYGVLYVSKESNGNFFAHTTFGINEEKLDNLVIKTGHGLLGRAMQDHSVVIIDSVSRASKDTVDFREAQNIKNLIAVPIYFEKRSFGMIVVGNRLDRFKYKNDDIDMVKVFAKQITIALEKDILVKKTQELAVKDEMTGLSNKNYIITRLEEEIKRAIFFQRPCSFLIFNIDDFNKIRESQGEVGSEDILRKVANLVKDSISPIGKAARIGGDEFAILLPEKNKKEATFIAEEIRKRVEAASFATIKVTISGGVSENPIDGSTCEELFKKATDSLRYAKSLGKNRVVA